MSQVPVKWCSQYDLANTSEQVAFTGQDPIPVIPLTALQEVVEGLQKLVNEARGFEAMANDQSHGYTNRRILRERIDEAQRLLASLGEVGT